MLFRQRAWDLMREDYAWVEESASLAEAAQALRASQQTSPENNVVLVLSAPAGGASGGARRLKGAVSVWKVLQALDECALRDPDLKLLRATDFDKALARASAACAQTPLSGHLEPDVPVLAPGDPLPVVLELFLRQRRDWAVVEENGQVLGVVLVADLYRAVAGGMS